MRFVITKPEAIEKPKKKCSYHNMKAEIDEFMNSNARAVKVRLEDYEFADIKSVCNAVFDAAIYYMKPIDVVQLGKEVYLVRTDI